LGSVFLGFAAVACVGGLVAAFFLSETRFRVLEEVSP